MALSRLSSAPKNASGYALPITQLTKGPPGPEAKVDSVLFISLSSLGANLVQASALPPQGNAKQPSHAGSQFSLAQRRPRHHHTQHNSNGTFDRTVAEQQIGRRDLDRVLCRAEGRCSRVRLQSMRQASFCQASPSTLRCASPVFLSAADLPAFARRAAAVYLLRSAQYQFGNCGVLYLCACRCSTCIELNFEVTEGTMAKKAKKAKKKTGKKKKK
jgi:hypothetical protein